MSGKEFFVRRYEDLGWKHHDVELKQAIRINTMNADEADVVNRLRSRGIQLEKIPFLKHGYWVVKSGFSVGATEEYLLGLYSIQEAAAQIPASLFAELDGKVVLDACAAPGGKTIQLADLMGSTGVIVALDVDRRRLAALSNHLERCRATNAVVYNVDARMGSSLDFRFDRILLDVPCSGNFVTDRAWFSRRTLRDVQRNSEVQRQILSEASKSLAADGEIVYSTCSLEPEENELNIDWAIKILDLAVQDIECYGDKGLTNVFGTRLDGSIEKCRRIWPELTQGFFVCKLRKRE